MMWTLQTPLFLLACVLVWAAPCCCEPLSSDAGVRLSKPKSFQSVDDLRTYLDQLGLYYAVAGRPRFGKRTAYNPRGEAGSWSTIIGENRFFPVENNEQLYNQLYSSQEE